MKLMVRMWGRWGLMLLLAFSLAVPTAASAFTRGGDKPIDGPLDEPPVEVVGDPTDGGSGRPLPVILGVRETADILLQVFLAQYIGFQQLERIPALQRLSFRVSLRGNR